MANQGGQQLGGEDCLVPQPRGKLSKAFAIGLSAVVTMAIVLFEPDVLFRHTAMVILILTVGTLLHGGCLLSEEFLRHATTRYRAGGLGQMMKACVGVSTILGVAMAGLLFRLTEPHSCGDQWSMVVMGCGLYPLLKTMGVLGPSEVEVSAFCEERKMNVAHGLAWSFYLGYLNLVLPRLEDSIAEFSAKNLGDPFQTRGFRKLLILLPVNANITHKLEDADTNIRFYDNLPNTEIDRAGVRGRVYKHSVYRILDENRQVHHCVVEYATPLLTLYKMSQESSAAFGERDRREQVLLFYRTLQDILDCSLECRNRYRLILLSDENEDDPHFLSKAILKNLDQQKEEFNVLHHNPLVGDWHRANEHIEPMSTEPTLMISDAIPHTLRIPVENMYDPTLYCQAPLKR
ncbi:stimulator of interferon genes protein [Esox lucius]|uniref:Stimulator of interferon genes protein n=1 Tax=Esox lucius TaxID=8010 RepID=A0A3P8ZSI0_ESOLU|nr:stimulator of interferon genes protein [Esox lucius]